MGTGQMFASQQLALLSFGHDSGPSFFSVSLRDKEINYFNSAEDAKSCCSSWKKETFAFFVKVTRFLNNMYFKIIVHPWEFSSCFCAK